MSLVDFITDKNAFTFILLFTRISGFFAFMPFFSHASISVNIKVAFALYLTILFFPIAKIIPIDITTSNMIILVLSELFIGFIS